MIYLDNAATTFPKPASVSNAVITAMRTYGANPGRSGHKMSIRAAEEIYRCRETAAEFFHAKGAECVAFTQNCTHATNIVLKGLLKPGNHVVVSCLEHNAVMRPIQELKQYGVTCTEAKVVPGDNDATLNGFRNAINERTALICCMHASNVWGIRLPIERIGALCKTYQIPFMVDAAQTAGVFPIDMQDFGIDYLCLAGHKGLYGPMGTGMLITDKGEGLKTLIEGGTGTESQSFSQPATMPERMESGTVNLPGIAGLRAGIEFVRQRSIKAISRHEMKLITALYDRLSSLKHVELFMPRPEETHFAPLLSFNVKGKESEEVASYLNRWKIATRAGLHCAPTAHIFAGTLERGAVRVCPSVFSSLSEIDALYMAIRKII